MTDSGDNEHSGANDCYAACGKQAADTRPRADVTLICAACGYQWDQSCVLVRVHSGPDCPGRLAPSTFYENCPTCEANMVHVYEPEKAETMGEDFDGMPWY
jgi:hypothetical protein